MQLLILKEHMWPHDTHTHHPLPRLTAVMVKWDMARKYHRIILRNSVHFAKTKQHNRFLQGKIKCYPLVKPFGLALHPNNNWAGAQIPCEDRDWNSTMMT